jgi:hypothetical protein
MRVLAAAVLLSLTLAPALAQAPAPAPKIEYLDVAGSGFADPSDVVAPGRIMRYFTRTPAVAAQARAPRSA